MLKTFLAPQLEQWLHLLAGVLAGAASDYGLRTAAVRACTTLLRALPKRCSKLVHIILAPVWQLLIAGAGEYSREILAGDDMVSVELDEDGTAICECLRYFRYLVLSVIVTVQATC